jgi:hypothetical protein
MLKIPIIAITIIANIIFRRLSTSIRHKLLAIIKDRV